MKAMKIKYRISNEIPSGYIKQAIELSSQSNGDCYIFYDGGDFVVFEVEDIEIDGYSQIAHFCDGVLIWADEDYREYFEEN